MIHGFGLSKEGSWGKVANKFSATKDMMKLYIDWDADMQTKMPNFKWRINPSKYLQTSLSLLLSYFIH